MAEPSRISVEAWSTRIGVILAVTGSAVGLGNFLRFPGIAAKYDGGTFMIPYFVAFLVLGLPIAWAEWAMGRYGGSKGYRSTPGIYRAIWKSPVAPYMGLLGLLIPVVIYMYYVFIESWCLGYAFSYLIGDLSLGKDAGAYSNFFSKYTGQGSDGILFTTFGRPMVFLLICMALNTVLIYRGLSRGIEKFCLYAMPLLVACAIIILIRVLTLGTPDPSQPDLNILNALGHMWNPRSSGGSLLTSLANGEMWLEASSQIFFSLSVGFGIIITYSSYLKRNDDIALSSTTSAAGNEFCEVSLGGLITIPAAFIFLGAAGTTGGTFGLGFNALPMVFEHMPAGRLFGFLFFFLLFLAAVTSSLSMLQPAIAFLEEGLSLNRSKSVTLLTLITAAGTSFIVFNSKGLVALDNIDFWVGSFCIFVLATFQVIMFGWIMGADKGMEELDRGAEIRIPRFFKYILKYVSPVYLITIFVIWVNQKMHGYVTQFAENSTVRWSILFIVMVALIFLFLIFLADQKWRAAEAAKKGEELTP